MSADQPIPEDLVEPDIEGIAVGETGEPLVVVVPGSGLHVAPAYHAQGLSSARNEIMLREGVIDGLRIASAVLPNGIEILVWDGIRSLETQRELIRRFVEVPPVSGDTAVEKYLAPPPESEDDFKLSPPPHATGGAVDVTLCDSSGVSLNLGADFDEFGSTAWLAYFEDASLPDSRMHDVIRERRRLLFWAMCEAGFAPWPWEFWHYELNTVLAASYHGETTASYGAAVPWSLE